MTPIQPMWHFYWDIILFTLENRCISCHATHATYAACQRNLPIAIQHYNCPRHATWVMPQQPNQITVFIYHHHHHIALVAWISLTLSRHSSLSFIALGRSSGQHPVSSHSCWMYVRAGRPAFARPCVGIHKSTSLMSSYL